MTPAKTSSSLSVKDNRTGKDYEFEITDGTIKAIDLRAMKVDDSDFGLMTYDPAFMNTANCRSAITFIDGDVGILRYRGYPIEQLAEKSTFLEVSYLLIFGELPTQAQLDTWSSDVMRHVYVNEAAKEIIGGFRHDAHPMGMLQATIGALGTFYPESKGDEPDVRYRQMIRLLGKTPTLGAWAFRHMTGRKYIEPDKNKSYAQNFLDMMFSESTIDYEANAVLTKALDVLFILHADHEQNCSTTAVRGVGSSESDMYSSVSAGVGALYGPLHGGANEAVLTMLRGIGSVDNVPEFVKAVKNREALLMGFGHRVYKNYDPRARIVKGAADDVFEVTGVNPLLKIAVELERIALEDEFFIARKLYPNVDFYSGLIYEALGIPAEMFTVLFAIGRMPGWIAQWSEMRDDKEQKIARPRQIYTGYDERKYVAIKGRKAAK